MSAIPTRIVLLANVAYMPVPRCDQCKLWTLRDVSNIDADGVCSLGQEIGGRMWPELYDRIITKADFGCVDWRRKP